ncbi:SMI1/KNR4 family protein [Actinoplanes siamensis]|uniref:SMI1/KNR4 family protein n=1 Tax=Actinoplanes siamensis TaxID=1223317 RepID=A0A919NFS1_9ACTN|nr:SMI1/KNR4 family protein [Actinoplanes siamensis]GIF09884.1 hypothetical protein Asi03nite_74220 [Actinoplanes siamensis]
MPDIDDATLAATLPFSSIGALPGDAVPAAWMAIAAIDDSAERAAETRRAWPAVWLEQLPQFAEILNTRLVDVRIVSANDVPALMYVIDHPRADRVVTWLGYDPATFGETPRFWDSFPEPLQDFLQHTHAGFVSHDNYSFGLFRPSEMVTMAETAGSPDGIDFWDEIQPYPSTRLLQIAANGPGTMYCLSPEVPTGELVLADEAEAEVLELGPALDDLMMARFSLTS